MRFRKKPVVIEAVRYVGGNDRDGYRFAEMQPQWLSDAFHLQPGHPGAVWRTISALNIGTLEGSLTVSPGDWIIRGISGELYPCKPYIFDATYEPEDTP